MNKTYNPKELMADAPEKKEVIETITDFKNKIDAAKMAAAEDDSQPWVETTPEVIKYYNRKGLGGAEYYMHEGVRVCEYGKKEAILAREKESMDQRLHGDKEAVREQA